MYHKNKKFVLSIVLLSFLFFSLFVEAAGVPTIISYQGRLADSSGNLLGGAGTTYYFKFSVWDNSTVGSGARLWPTSAPSSSALSVRSGVFSVNIGDTVAGYPDALDYNFNTASNIYLQVEVSSDNSTFQTLSPRQRVSATPFSQLSSAVSGSTMSSSFGTTTPFSTSVVSIQATSTGATALSLRAILGQIANLFQIQDSTGTNLLSVNATGGLSASSTLGVTGATNLYSTLNVLGQTTLGNASSTGLTIGTGSSVAGRLFFANASNNFTTQLVSSSTQASNLNFTLPGTLGSAGQAILADGTGGLYFGTVAGGSGITSINSLSSAVQLLVAGTAGSDFSIVSGTDTHTFNIPNAGSVARGLVSTTTQTFAGNKTFSGDTFLSGTLGVTATSTLATTTATQLTVTGQTTLGNASSTAFTVSGKTTLGNASSTALTATALYSTTANLGAVTGTTGAFTGALSGSNFSGSSSGANTGDQTSVTGNAGTVTFADAAGDTTTFLALGIDLTGSLSPRTDAGLTYNATTDALTAVTFIGALTGNVTGNVSGTAATVTGAAQTSITSLGTLTGLTMSGALSMGANTITSGLINGQTISSAANFTGSVAVGTTLGVTATSTLATTTATQLTVTGLTTLGNASSSALTVSGKTTLANASSTALTATALYSTNANLGAVTGTTGAFTGALSGSNFSGSSSGTNTGDQTSVTGNAGTVTFADAAGDTTTFLALGIDLTGSLSPRTDAGLTYNATTDALTAVTFIGALTGNVTGNVSGTSATVTGAAQTSITSLGTLTGLTMSGALSMGANTITSGLINGQTISSAANFTGSVAVGTTLGVTATSTLATTTATQLTVTGQTTLGNASSTALTVSGKTTLANASSTALTATALYSTTANLGAVTGTTGAFTGALSGSNFSGSSSGANTGDQTSVTGNAGTVTFADAAGDTTTFLALGIDLTGSLSPRTDAGLTYNATTDALTAVTFIGALTGNVTGNVSGTSATVTGAAQTSITSLGTLTGLTMSGALSMGANTITSGLINGQTISSAANFTGSVLVGTTLGVTATSTLATTTATQLTVTGQTTLGNASSTALTVSGKTTLANASSTALTATALYSTTANLGAVTGTTGAFTGALSGSNFSGSSSGANTGDQTSVTGNAGTVTFADAAGDTTTFLALGIDLTGSLSPRTDAGLTYNATTDALTAVTFIGALTGNVTGNVSGTAATVTGAAQTSITSLGTLTGLTMSGALSMGANTITSGLINGQTISSASNFTGSVAVGTTLGVTGTSTLATTTVTQLIASGTITAGSGSTVLTGATGNILHDALVDCADTQILKWAAGGARWGCSADVSGGTPSLNTVSAATAGATIANANNALVWNWGTLTTQAGMTFGGGTAMTTGNVFTVGGATYVHTTAETGNLAGITFTDSSTNTSGNSITSGLNISSTVNTSGAGTKDINAVNVSAPTLTGCATGACSWDGLMVNTQSTGAASTITQNGLNIAAAGIGAGALNGVNIGSITAGAGTETAINVGSGWDTILGGTTAGTNIFSFTNASLTSAGALTVTSCVGCGGATTIALASDHTLSSTTGTKVSMDVTSLAAGTYTFDYYLLVQTATLTVSPLVGVNFTGTATANMWFEYADLSSTLLAAIGTMSDVGTNAVGFGMRSARSAFSTTAPNMGNTSGATNAMQTLNTNTLVKITGLLVVTAPGNLELWHSSETATATTVKAGSSVIVKKIGAGADLAEIYGTMDTSISPGDVVSLDSSLNAGVKKSDKAYDRNTIGIVSTSPSLTMGTMDDLGATPVLVALSGRVPVKVSTENGAIQPGDLLTSSSIPGVAMRATKAGVIIGQAMTSFNTEGVGVVIAFIKNGQGSGAKLTYIFPGLFTEGEAIPNDFGKQILAQLVSQKESIATSTVSEIFTDRLAVGLEIIAPRGIFDGLEVNSIGALNNETTFTSDTIFFGRPYFTTDTAGFAVVKKGGRSVSVTFDKEYLEQPIVNASISLNDTDDSTQNASVADAIFSNDIRYLITKKNVRGFTVLLNKPATEDVQFSWIAVAVKGAKTFESVSVSETVTTPSLPPVSEHAPVVEPDATPIIPVEPIKASEPEIFPIVESAPTSEPTPTPEPEIVPAVEPTPIITPEPVPVVDSTPASEPIPA